MLKVPRSFGDWQHLYSVAADFDVVVIPDVGSLKDLLMQQLMTPF